MNNLHDIEQEKKHFENNTFVFEQIYRNMGKKLTEIRKKIGYTQQEVAEIIGIGRATLSNYEKGERTIDIVTLHKLCSLYCISIDYLVGMKETPEPESNYEEKFELLSSGFSPAALEHIYTNNDFTELINDLVLHPNFAELEELLHHSRYTRYEYLDNGYRSFLTSKLLYSMLADIYKEWYVDNDNNIHVLTDYEKETLLADINKYIETHTRYEQATKAQQSFEYLDDMDDQIRTLYKKLKKYL